jgi:hypothetical protein
VSHIDPEVLALRALGETAGTYADDAHLPGCAHCQAELDKFAEVVSIARRDERADQLLKPPAQVWARIAQEVGPEASTGVQSDAGLQPGADLEPGPGPAPGPGPETAAPQPEPGWQDRGQAGRQRAGRPASSRRVSWWRRPIAVGLAGLLVGFGVAAGIRQLAASPAATPATPVVATIPLRPLPQFPQWNGVFGTALMERATTGRLLSVKLHAPSKPGFYEVWLLARDGVKMISLGDLNRDHTGLFAMPPGVNLAEYSRIDVSLQPFNGSTLHSADSVVRGSLP